MYLKLQKKKIEIHSLTRFWDRFKGLKFYFEPLEHGVHFPKKRWVTTNFLCQRIDIIMTDKNNQILYLYENFKSEKYIFLKLKVHHTYFFPLNTACHFKKGDSLPIVDMWEEQKKVKKKAKKQKKKKIS